MTTRIAVQPQAFDSPAGERRTARSIGAVIAGLVTIFAITTATAVALHATARSHIVAISLPCAAVGGKLAIQSSSSVGAQR